MLARRADSSNFIRVLGSSLSRAEVWCRSTPNLSNCEIAAEFICLSAAISKIRTFGRKRSDQTLPSNCHLLCVASSAPISDLS